MGIGERNLTAEEVPARFPVTPSYVSSASDVPWQAVSFNEPRQSTDSQHRQIDEDHRSIVHLSEAVRGVIQRQMPAP